MNITFSYETVFEMLDIIRGLKEDRLDLEQLSSLLDHKDYQVEFSRYKGRVNKEEFMDFLKNFKTLDPDKLDNRDLKVHYHDFKYLLENLDLYYSECKKFKEFTPELFETEVKKALKGLPDGFEFDTLNFIFTISIGQSFGWAHESNSHFDVIQLIKNHSLETFKTTIAHETHHVGISILDSKLNLDLAAIPVEQLFYLCFTGEGLAVKYCNNASGILTKSINPEEEANLGLDKFTWDYLNSDFDRTFKTFINHIEMMRKKEVKTFEELNVLLQDYWMSPYTDEQSKNEIPKLKHFRLYSFGNDIWGVIHDVFGKETVYKIYKDLSLFPAYYNEAVEKIGKPQYKIPM